MTRIITLCSGLARAGKTHLAVNLACEMVRRGRHASLFCQDGAESGIDDLLALTKTTVQQRRSTDHNDALLRRAYLGVDVLAAGIPLSGWNDAATESVDGMIADMQSSDGCDDFIVDTSGMDPRTQLACARAASMVVLVITSDARSCAETFAMLRILRLNGFEGGLYLVVNLAGQVAEANDLYDSFRRMLLEHLQLDVPLLGVIPRDVHVSRAESAKQAFTCIYPDAEAATRLVAIADAIDMRSEQDNTAGKPVAEYWSDFREIFAKPVSLPGGVFLETTECKREVVPQAQTQARDVPADMMLLQIDSSFYMLADALGKLPGLLHATADEVSALLRLLESANNPILQDNLRETNDSEILPELTVALIREIEQVLIPSRDLHLQVYENRVQGDDPDWLQDGRYLKFIFRFQAADDVIACIEAFLKGITGFLHYTAEQGESLWEMVVADRSGGMNIIHSADGNTRIQVWLPLLSRQDSGVKSRLKLVKPSQPPG